MRWKSTRSWRFRRTAWRSALCLPRAALVALGLLGLLGCGDESPSRLGALVESGAESRIDAEEIAARLEALRALPLGEAYREALEVPDPLMQHLLLAQVYARVDASNFDQLRAVFESDMRNPDGTQARIVGNLWAKIDPVGALSAVMRWDDPRARTFASHAILNVWIQRMNADAARQAFRDVASELPLPVVQQGEQALAEALGRHGNLDSLLRLLEEAEDVDHRHRMIATSMIEFLRRDADAWTRWAEKIHRDGALRERAPEVQSDIVLQAIRLLAQRDVDEVVAWYPTIADGDYSGDALILIAERWARIDPEATLAFLAGRPDAERPEMARRAVAYVWLKKEPEVALAKLRAAIDEDPDMVSVIFPLVQFLIASRVDEAMELAQRVPDAKEREIVLKQGLMRWARLDPAAADAYMARHPVSEPILRAVRAAKALKSTTHSRSRS